MTGLNHTLTGAVIAVWVKDPGLAIPLSFISHFILDALPHFGVHYDDIFERNRDRYFKMVTRTDFFFTLGLVIVMPALLHTVVDWKVTLACMLAAIAPDFIWMYRFWYEVRHGRVLPRSRFSRFHKAIQRYERVWGIWVELGYASLMGLMIGKLI